MTAGPPPTPEGAEILSTREGCDRWAEIYVDEALAATSPRAQRYLGWPLLVVMRLTWPRSSAVNDGQPVTSLTLADRDGILLVRE